MTRNKHLKTAHPRYTAAQVIMAIKVTKGLVSLTAKRLGCERKTIYRYVERHPEVAEALREEREAMTDIAELALFSKVQDGEAWAVCFYLKTQGKARGYVERSEITIDYVRREAVRLAEKYGLDADDIVREAETIVKETH